MVGIEIVKNLISLIFVSLSKAYPFVMCLVKATVSNFTLGHSSPHEL